MYDNELIAYGGLVHLSWPDKRAEVSFLADPARAADPETYRQDFQGAPAPAGASAAFDGLKLNRLFTETYDIRPAHVAILEEAGFRLEGRLRQHVQLHARYFCRLPPTRPAGRRLCPQPLHLPFKRIFISGAAGVIGQEMVRVAWPRSSSDIQVLAG